MRDVVDLANEYLTKLYFLFHVLPRFYGLFVFLKRSIEGTKLFIIGLMTGHSGWFRMLLT